MEKRISPRRVTCIASRPSSGRIGMMPSRAVNSWLRFTTRPRFEIKSPGLITLVGLDRLVEVRALLVENHTSRNGAANRFRENVWNSVPFVCVRLIWINGNGFSTTGCHS